MARYDHGQPASTQGKPGHCRASAVRRSAHRLRCKTSQARPWTTLRVAHRQRLLPIFKKFLFGTAKQPPYPPRLGRSRTAGAAPPRPPGLRPLRTSGAWAPTWPTSKRQQRPSPQNNPQRVLNSKPIYHLIKHKKTACRRFLAFGRVSSDRRNTQPQAYGVKNLSDRV